MTPVIYYGEVSVALSKFIELEFPNAWELDNEHSSKLLELQTV